MKNQLILLFSLALLNGNAQTATDVYSAHLTVTASDYQIEQLKNLSQNPGYDNQPSFWSENELLYASTRNGQTDVLRHHLVTNKKEWRCTTTIGSEYSPLRIPEREVFSAIRLDSTERQRLYRYAGNGIIDLVHPMLKVGYQLWIDANNLLCTVLIENRMDLYWLVVDSGTATRLQTNVGRSLHLLPNKELLSYTHNKDGIAIVTTLDQKTKEQTAVFELPKGVQDHAWLPNGEIVYGQGSALYTAPPMGKARLLYQFAETEIKNISRIAIGPKGKRIALVGEEIDQK